MVSLVAFSPFNNRLRRAPLPRLCRRRQQGRRLADREKQKSCWRFTSAACFQV